MSNSQRADKLNFLEYNLKVNSKNRTIFLYTIALEPKTKTAIECPKE
jgi:hypothetical protein